MITKVAQQNQRTKPHKKRAQADSAWLSPVTRADHLGTPPPIILIPQVFRSLGWTPPTTTGDEGANLVARVTNLAKACLDEAERY